MFNVTKLNLAIRMGVVIGSITVAMPALAADETFNLNASFANGDTLSGTFSYNSSTQMDDGLGLTLKNSSGSTLDNFNQSSEIVGGNVSGLVIRNPTTNDQLSLSFENYLSSGQQNIELDAAHSGAWVPGGYTQATSGTISLAPVFTGASSSSPAPLPPLAASPLGIMALLGGLKRFRANRQNAKS